MALNQQEKENKIDWKQLKEFTTTGFHKEFVKYLNLEIERYNNLLDFGNDDMTQTFGIVKQRETIVDLLKKMSGWKTIGKKEEVLKIEDYN